jgi:hypothetical protein
MTTRARSSRQAGNLPGEATSFVGRRRETAQAVRLLRGARLWPPSSAGLSLMMCGWST